MSTRIMGVDGKEILVHPELLGSSDPNPMDLNVEETLVHRGPLKFLTNKSLEQAASFPIFMEITALNTKEEPISYQ